MSITSSGRLDSDTLLVAARASALPILLDTWSNDEGNPQGRPPAALFPTKLSDCYYRRNNKLRTLNWGRARGVLSK